VQNCSISFHLVSVTFQKITFSVKSEDYFICSNYAMLHHTAQLRLLKYTTVLEQESKAVYRRAATAGGRCYSNT